MPFAPPNRPVSRKAARSASTALRGLLACGLAACLLSTSCTFLVGIPGGARPLVGSHTSSALLAEGGKPGSSETLTGAWGASAPSATLLAFGGLMAAVCLTRAGVLQRRAAEEADVETGASRRGAVQMAGLMGTLIAAGEAKAEEDQGYTGVNNPDSREGRSAVANVNVPPRIKQDPYELIGLSNPDDGKADKQEFYMKKQYKSDTYQVINHMKISGSLDKGTPNMEKWNKRIKEEMDDWLALYRRQDNTRGKQSFTTLYTAVDSLAAHFVSYGPKFPFPNKRRPRLYQLINITEKYLERDR